MPEPTNRELQVAWRTGSWGAFSTAFPDLAFVVDADGRVLDFIAGDRSEELLYEDPEMFLDRAAHDVFPEELANEQVDVIRDAIESGETRRCEYSLEIGNGERRFEAVIEPVPSRVGAIDTAVWVARDVTECDEHERELSRQRALLEAQQDTVLDGLFVIDDDGEVLSFNDRFVEIWGIPEGVLEAGDEHAAREYALDQLVDPDAFLESIDRLETGDVETIRDEIALKDGRVLDRYITPLTGGDGTDFGLLLTFRDVTDRIEREAVLERQNERLAEFASIVSHDLRNPLDVAKGRLDLAMEDSPSEHHEPIARALDRMEDLIDGLLTLAREGVNVNALEAVDIPEVVVQSWANVRTDEATLEVRTESVVRADRSQLKQLLENLFRNAIVHAGDDVTVTVGDHDGGFFVADDGPGIPAGDRERVFVLGHSTRPEGTGFGLPIVRQIAEALGWTVRVADGASGGARFEFTGVSFLAD